MVRNRPSSRPGERGRGARIGGHGRVLRIPSGALMPENALAPLAAVLGIRTGSKVSLINPPPGFVQRLNPPPDGGEFLINSRTGVDVIMFFTKRAEGLVARLPALSKARAGSGGIWSCWKEEKPKPLSEDFI